MHVLLTTHGYPPTVSGVTLVAQRLARALVNRGHRVTVLAGSDRFTAYESYDRGVHVVRLESRKNPYWPANPVPTGAAEALQRLIDGEHPDAVHAHDALPFLLPLVRTRERLAAPLVATCHYYPSFVATYLADAQVTQEVVESITWQYTIALYNRVPSVVFATKTHLERFRAHGLTSHASVISNGVDLERYARDAAPLDLAARFGITEGPRILAVGRLARDKDLEVLIGAIRRLGPDGSQLLLVGEGPHQEALQEAARASGVDDRVHFLGFVPETELPGLYRACDVFAISSNHEVQSLPALQAAATGLPLVAAARGSLPEVCRDGVNGILVRTSSPHEWANAIRAVLEPDAHVRMGLGSLRVAAEHDEQRTFDQYEALYAGEVASRHSLTARPSPVPIGR